MNDEYVDITLTIKKDDLDKWHVYEGEDWVGWKLEQMGGVGNKWNLLVVLPSYDGVSPKWPIGTIQLHKRERTDTIE